MTPLTAVHYTDLPSLIEYDGLSAGPKVSLYFSVPRSSAYAIHGREELKSLSDHVKHELRYRHVSEEITHNLLRGLDAVQHNAKMWEHRAEGYAIFVSPVTAGFMMLPFATSRLALVAEQFYVRPLVPLLHAPQSILLVEVGHGESRLVRVTPRQTTVLPLQEQPIAAGARRESTPILNRTYHTASGGPLVQHGATMPHGNQTDAKHEETERLAEHLARLLSEALRRETAPLIVTAPQDLAHRFVRHLDYPTVLISQERIPVPGPSTEASDLHNLWHACERVVNGSAALAASALEDFGTKESRGHTSSDLYEIAGRACEGKVAELLIEKGDHLPESEATASAVSDAIIHTILHRGRVIEVEKGKLSSPVAAILRAGTIPLHITKDARVTFH